MKSFRHALATLTRRLRWEIAVFLLLVSAQAFTVISSPGTSTGWSSIVLLMFWWLTLRIVLSETGHPTFGGWRTRPFTRNSVLCARFFLLTALATIALVVRFLTLWHLFHPTSAQWLEHMKIVGGSLGVPWLIFASGLALIAFSRRFPLQGRTRKAGGTALIIATAVATAWTLRSGSRFEIHRTGGNARKFDIAIQQALPQAKRFVGPWEMTGDSRLARQILRISFAAPTENPAPGLRLLDLRHSAEGSTVLVTLTMAILDRGVARQLSTTVPVLGFADGSYGGALSFDDEGWRLPQSMRSDLPRLKYIISFASPLSLPENRGADSSSFPPTEILFFAQAPKTSRLDVTPADLDTKKDITPVPTPDSIPPLSAALEFKNSVTALIDSLTSGSDLSSAQRWRIADLPPEAIDPILAYHPWPKMAWQKMIRPFLLRHATEAHKPALLTRLATDERLGGFFIEKGWADDALPVLRHRAIERLPLDAKSLTLLANEKDPVLAPHLAALAVHLWDVEKLAPALRDNPGFDWPAFVKLGWKSRKYLNYDRQGWRYARWAAELGDKSALRRLAEEAARGKKWETEHLRKLVPGAPEDIVAYLRENLDQLKYDPQTRVWRK